MMDICTENSIIVRKYVLKIYPCIFMFGALYRFSGYMRIRDIVLLSCFFYIIMRMFQK